MPGYFFGKTASPIFRWPGTWEELHDCLHSNARRSQCGYGESSGPTSSARRLLMPAITSASIACGFHAGDPVMRETVALLGNMAFRWVPTRDFPDLLGSADETFERRRVRLRIWSYTRLGHSPRSLPLKGCAFNT